jgi:hypothetical protein
VHSQGTVIQATAEHLEDVPTADEHYADEVIAPAATLAFEPQDEPAVNVAEESEIQVEEGNEQVHEATTIQENSVKENIEVVSADITEVRHWFFHDSRSHSRVAAKRRECDNHCTR